MNYQTIVLSGGGAKGPYGLGVLLALQKFHGERKMEVTKIYCGTSVGALNATLAAQGDLDQLIELYSQIRTENILGVTESKLKKLRMVWVANRRPFSYFENTALRSTIEKFAKFDKLRDSHLLICATNYKTGDLETFYISRVIDDFLAHEQSHQAEMRCMVNYHRIESQDEFVQALLASTAIPFYLPPVEIGKSLYVDGGVGNNTPLKQAAYISRFLNLHEGAVLQPTICVINDPSRFTIDPGEFNDAFGVIRRTMDIYHNELVSDLHLSWERINKEVRLGLEHENRLISHIQGLQGVSAEKLGELAELVRESLRATSTSTPRCHLPLIVVRPTTPLLDDILHFAPATAKRLRRHGVADCFAVLENKNHITAHNQRRWTEEIE
ncbi:MAG: patatin-like phospholipase family protein [Rhodoferax sp.]|nr:patatin-like phospholipase family protein [Rhodoferax sp.]